MRFGDLQFDLIAVGGLGGAGVGVTVVAIMVFLVAMSVVSVEVILSYATSFGLILLGYNHAIP